MKEEKPSVDQYIRQIKKLVERWEKRDVGYRKFFTTLYEIHCEALSDHWPDNQLGCAIPLTKDKTDE